MQKIKMVRGVTLTFEEGCNKYLENCRQRNLREGTIEHYRQSYVQFYNNKCIQLKTKLTPLEKRCQLVA